MTEYPGLLLGMGLIFALAIAEIVFSIWVFRLPFSRRDEIQNRIVGFLFKKIVLMKEEPDGYTKSQMTLGFICFGNIVGDLMGAIMLVIAGWVYVGGQDGELAGFILVWIGAPVMLLGVYFYAAIWLLSHGAYRRFRHKQRLGHDLLAGETKSDDAV